jgi:formylglycine-generating enzyme required for sulfatase activity
MVDQILRRWTNAIATTSATSRTASPEGDLSYSWPAMLSAISTKEGTVSVPQTYHLWFPPVPENMVMIHGGEFCMGSLLPSSVPLEVPVHTAMVFSIFMDRYEVYGTLWNDVRNWATNHGYTDINVGQVGYSATGGLIGVTHPVINVSWYDCIKWCNARSEREGLIPVYYTNGAQTGVYRAGFYRLDNSMVDWNANGYRLPTEAEWEKAGRGGLTGFLYPWGNKIDGAMANFRGSGDPYDEGTTPVGYYSGAQVINGQSVWGNTMNGFGLYDMAGNVYEWCWDWYGPLTVSDPPENPRGPDNGRYRVLRGGCWQSTMTYCLLCSFRHYMAPTVRSNTIGFRCVRRL